MPLAANIRRVMTATIKAVTGLPLQRHGMGRNKSQAHAGHDGLFDIFIAVHHLSPRQWKILTQEIMIMHHAGARAFLAEQKRMFCQFLP